ncbi:hypothetical protein [Streptomyces parvus]|uniref:PLL-like beta propeller domain-containing protein n=1 Tax=Streptomyces parvus TaxID=66428 RepID=A0A7K3RY84_9ACTN|nr:hypothetical protein [Streptomyces parvus]NEC20195.1 hypothetical protein [Streptomyces parvus]
MTRHALSRRAASAVLALTTLTAGAALTGLSLSPAAAAPATGASATVDPIDPDSLILSRWMGQVDNVIGDRPLNEIVMPGSHDAGSWSITDKSGVCDTASEAKLAREHPQIAAAISITQLGTIKQQLEVGSRYLDLRLCKQNGKWYTYHGGPLGGLFFDDPATGRKGEINEIAEWLRNHPEEIVTIELRTSVPADQDPSDGRDTAAEDTREAVELLGRSIGTSRMADRGKLAPTSTYNQFVQAGANVVLIDTKNSTNNAWAWPSHQVESRNSYVENKDWGGLIKEALKNPGSSSPAIDLVSRTALKRNEEVLRTDTGDPNKFFTLSGNVDSTLAIPDAAADVVTNGMNYKPDGLAYMLYLAREHNFKLLEKLEGPWRHSDIARNTNIVQLDFINMGGYRANGKLLGSGGMSAAIIANNTPTAAPGTLLGAERLADGKWSGAQALPGAYGALEFAGGERSVAAMPNGDVHFTAYGNDKHLYHNVRLANGSWQGWNRVNSDAVDNKLNGGPLALAATPDGTLHVLSVDKGGNLLHTLRRPDGSWQDGGWGSVGDGGNGVMKAKDVAVTGLPNNSIKVLVYGKDGAMRLTERYANGEWEQRGWQVIPGVGNSKTFVGSDLSIAATPDHTLQIAAIGQDRNVWHMTQNRQSVNSGWGRPEWAPGKGMEATAVALAALPDGSSQLVAVGMDGNTWHTKRAADGRWTAFAGVSGPWKRPLAAKSVKIAGLPDGRSFTLVDAR